MLKVFPDYRHAYVINGEVYLLGFDPEQAASNLTELGKAIVELLYQRYQDSQDEADTFINTVKLQGRSIRSFNEQVEAYIAAHAMTEQSFPTWFRILQLVDKVESKYARWGIGMESRTHIDNDNQRYHLRCN